MTDDGAVLEKSEVKPTVIGPEGEPIPAKGLVLGIEKFRRPDKHYRLIWLSADFGREWFAWLAEEDETRFRRKAEAVAAGAILAAAKGGLKFSQVTR